MQSWRKDDPVGPDYLLYLSVVFALISSFIALWFFRLYELNAGLVGWGDASADAYQKFLWWGRRVSVSVLLLFVIIASLRSRRLFLTATSAGIFCAALMLTTRLTGVKWIATPLLPGIFGYMLAFGVHSDIGELASVLWVWGLNAFVYTLVFAGLFTVTRSTLGAKS
jgi:hypothetical protein